MMWTTTPLPPHTHAHTNTHRLTGMWVDRKLAGAIDLSNHWHFAHQGLCVHWQFLSFSDSESFKSCAVFRKHFLSDKHWEHWHLVSQFVISSLTSQTKKAVTKTSDGLKMICSSQSGRLRKQLLVMSAVFPPWYLSGMPKSAVISCSECPVMAQNTPCPVSHHLLQDCCWDGPLPLVVVVCRGSVGTNLLPLAAIQPAEHVESAAEALWLAVQSGELLHEENIDANWC